MAATVVLVVLGGVTSDPALDLAGLAPLIIAMAWTALGDRQVIEARLDDNAQKLMRRLDGDNQELHRQLGAIRRAMGAAVYVPDHGADAYVHGRAILLDAKDRGGWESVRLYAPIGLWSGSASKEAWLDTLASELGNSVERLIVVAGLPADQQTLHSVSIPMLRRFADKPGMELYFMPPATHEQSAAAPAFGVAIFSDRERGEYRAVLAFVSRPASSGRPALGNLIDLGGEPTSRILIDWFDDCLLKSYLGNVMLGADWSRGESLDARIEAAGRSYY